MEMCVSADPMLRLFAPALLPAELTTLVLDDERHLQRHSPSSTDEDKCVSADALGCSMKGDGSQLKFVWSTTAVFVSHDETHCQPWQSLFGFDEPSVELCVSADGCRINGAFPDLKRPVTFDFLRGRVLEFGGRISINLERPYPPSIEHRSCDCRLPSCQPDVGKSNNHCDPVCGLLVPPSNCFTCPSVIAEACRSHELRTLSAIGCDWSAVDVKTLLLLRIVLKAELAYQLMVQWLCPASGPP